VASPAVFWFDFNSPYAYLAAERIGDLIPGAEWKPLAFPRLLYEIGKLEEAMARDPSVAVDVCSERAAQRGLPPVRPPEGWPTETWSMLPLRAALFAAERGLAEPFCLAAFRKLFVESRSLGDPETVRAAAFEAGLDPDETLEAAARPEIKQRLKDHTSEALAAGITGIPAVVVHDEVFWGDDRLEEAAAAVASS
jgi:2-hydroxychromene-2-carboxylate isomerase